MSYNQRYTNIGCTTALLVFVIAVVIWCVTALVVSLPVLWLWNWLVPSIFGLRAITWIEALGLSLLCSFLLRTNVSVNNNKSNNN